MRRHQRSWPAAGGTGGGVSVGRGADQVCPGGGGSDHGAGSGTAAGTWGGSAAAGGGGGGNVGPDEAAAVGSGAGT